MYKKKCVSIIGSGSWATALATVLASKGIKVKLWTRSDKIEYDINENRENRKYLKGVKLDKNIWACIDMKNVLEGSRYIVMAVPTQAYRHVLINTLEVLRIIYGERLADFLQEAIFINVAKGIEIDSLKLISEITAEIDNRINYCVLSGPSHAEEVGEKRPTTVVVSSTREGVAKEVQDLFMTDRFRVYINQDMIGVELGGALKNIIALGVGISDGLGLGDNSKAALMTRGLKEIAKLGEKKGAKIETFLGLTGMGDLIVTCTSEHSRNRQCGLLIGKSGEIQEAISKIGMVVEGIWTSKSAYSLAKKLEVQMPITQKIFEVIEGQIKPKDAVDILMGRERKHE